MNFGCIYGWDPPVPMLPNTWTSWLPEAAATRCNCVTLPPLASVCTSTSARAPLARTGALFGLSGAYAAIVHAAIEISALSTS